MVDSVGVGAGGHLRRIKRVEDRVTAIESVIQPVAGVTEVFTKDDLPAPSGGVITLNPDWVYNIRNQINLGTDVLEGHNVTIAGNQALQSLLFTNSSSALISSDADGYFNLIGLVANNDGGPFIDITAGAGPLSIVFMNLVFFTGDLTGLGTGTGSLGFVRSADRMTVSNSVFVGLSDGFTLDGVIGEVSMSSSSMGARTGVSGFTGVEATASGDFDIFLMDTLRWTTVDAGNECVNLSTSANYDSAVRMNGCTNRGVGGFIDAAGMQKSDPDFIVSDCEGDDAPADSLFTAAATFKGNTSETVIAVAGTQVRIGNGTPGHTLFNGGAFVERFTLSGAETQLQEFTYNGLRTRTFRISLDCELTRAGGGTVLIELAIQVNNVTVPDSETEVEVANTATTGYTATTVNLDPGDTIQLVTANQTNTQNVIVNSGRWEVSRAT